MIRTHKENHKMTEEQDVPDDEMMETDEGDQKMESPAGDQPKGSGEGMAGDMGASDVTSDDRLWAAIGYPIALIALIVLFMEDKKNRPFIRYHAVQAIAFSLILFVVYAIISVVTVGIGAICFPLIWLITLWPAYNAYQGKYMELPVLTSFLKNQGWVP
jgi:uncharacterized protein